MKDSHSPNMHPSITPLSMALLCSCNHLRTKVLHITPPLCYQSPHLPLEPSILHSRYPPLPHYFHQSVPSVISPLPLPCSNLMPHSYSQFPLSLPQHSFIILLPEACQHCHCGLLQPTEPCQTIQPMPVCKTCVN